MKILLRIYLSQLIIAGDITQPMTKRIANFTGFICFNLAIFDLVTGFHFPVWLSITIAMIAFLNLVTIIIYERIEYLRFKKELKGREDEFREKLKNYLKEIQELNDKESNK